MKSDGEGEDEEGKGDEKAGMRAVRERGRRELAIVTFRLQFWVSKNYVGLLIVGPKYTLPHRTLPLR